MIFISNTLAGIALILKYLLNIYFWIVIAACLISWVSPNPSNPIVQILRRLTAPVFYKVRKWLPFTYTSGLDFSPIVVLIAIELCQVAIVNTLAQYAAALH